MRSSSIAFAMALAVALPSGAALLGVHFSSDWASARFYVSLSGAGLAFGTLVIAVLDFIDFTRGRAVDLRLDVAQAEAKELANDEWRARLAAPVVVATEQLSHLVAHWHVYYRRLVLAGDAYGFDIRILTGEGEPTKVTSQPSWNYGTDQLAAAGWLVKVRGKGTTWAAGRDLVLWNAEEGWKQLPTPDYEPPDIEAPPYSKTKQQAKQAKQPAPASRAVVDQIRD